MKIVTVILFILFIISTIIAFADSTFKNKQHVLLCEAFRKEFGFLPGGITIYEAGGIFSAFQKDQFFFSPLILKKGSFIIRDMKPEHYDFIKNLPSEMTKWLKLKFFLLSASVFFLLTFLIFYYIAFKFNA